MHNLDELDFGWVESPLGWIELSASARGLVSLTWSKSPQECSYESHPIQQASLALACYFSGDFVQWDKLRKSIPLDEIGTPFQKKVWSTLREIPCGQVLAYGGVVGALGMKRGAQAVGCACGANPLPIFTPCHRVIAAHGLGGFSAGLEKKRWLLNHEQLAKDRSFATL